MRSVPVIGSLNFVGKCSLSQHRFSCCLAHELRYSTSAYDHLRTVDIGHRPTQPRCQADQHQHPKSPVPNRLPGSTIPYDRYEMQMLGAASTAQS